jgi:hypothetical protein
MGHGQSRKRFLARRVGVFIRFQKINRPLERFRRFLLSAQEVFDLADSLQCNSSIAA